MGETVDMPIALTGGVVYLLMSLTVWRMGRRMPQADVVRLWTLGGLCASACLLLIASRTVLPIALGYGLSTAMGAVAMLLQLGALRLLLARPRVWQPLVRSVLVLLALMLAVSWIGNRLWIYVAGCLALAALTGMLAWHARLTARRLRSRSAGLMAWSQAALALSFVVRGLGVAAGLAAYQPGAGGPAFTVHHVVVVLAALYGSLGFMGLLLDLTRRAEARAREGQVAEVARREVAEQAAQDLRKLLQQRDALAAERERMLQLLAHEIRQPLHNASGALQSAGQALRLPPAAGPDGQAHQVALRLGRADAVLGEVRAVLDNTLAAASLLSRSAPLAVQHVDLALLIDLALGDLDETQRSLVQVQWHTDLRQAEVESGLLRLALRNLLLNAFAHGGPGVAVQLRVQAQMQPPALLLCVEDNGVGLPAPPQPEPPGQRRSGQGLDIVRQVMALHGGRLALQTLAPSGLQACLVLPLPGG